MNVKLDIEINLIDKFIKDELYNNYNKILEIKINSVDNRFQVFNCIKNNEHFMSTSGIRILSSIQVPKGKIYNHSFILPNPKYNDIILQHDFLYEDERKNYLKKLYNSLLDWSNNWWGFIGDGVSKIIINDNKWTIECEKINDIFIDNNVEN